MIPQELLTWSDNPCYEKEQEMKECPECFGEGKWEGLSDCCAEIRDADTGLCYECHDHCGPLECDRCEGLGKIPIED